MSKGQSKEAKDRISGKAKGGNFKWTVDSDEMGWGLWVYG